jgi:hypothetical protein
MYENLLEHTVKANREIEINALKGQLITIFESSCSIAPTKEQIAKVKDMSWQQIAEALYQILDDVDTYSDACKENLQSFQDLVLKKQQEKNNYLYSDGQNTVRLGESNMGDHAKRELELAGMFDDEVDESEAAGSWNKLVAEAVVELVELMGGQGHSGASAEMTRELFTRLSNFEALTELTDSPDEWRDVSEYCGEHIMWQNTRASASFSTDEGKTYYNLDILAEGDDEIYPNTKDKKLFTSKAA